MRTPIPTIAVALMSVAGWAEPACAQGSGPGGKRVRMGKPMGPMAGLDLSAEQKP